MTTVAFTYLQIHFHSQKKFFQDYFEDNKVLSLSIQSWFIGTEAVNENYI